MRLIRKGANKRRRAFTMVEVIVAAGILAITVLGAVSAMFVTSRMARDSRYEVMAMEAINRQIELIKATNYDQLGPGGPAGSNFVAGDGATEAWETPFQYDPEFAENSPQFIQSFQWYGFGVATNGSASTIQLDASTWPAGVNFVGSFVTAPQISGSPGGAQMSRIVAQSDTGTGASRRIQFTLDARLTTSHTNSQNVDVAFGPGTICYIDGGKWCRVTVRWLPTWAKNKDINDPNNDEIITRSRDIFIGDPNPT